MWIPGDWAVTWAMLVSEGHAATGAMLVWVAPGAMVISGPRLHQGPCLGLWSDCSQGLCWSLWPMLPLRAVWMAGVRSAPWVHVGGWGPCYSQGYAYLSGCTSIWCYGDVDARAGTEGHIWVHGTTAARVCVDAQGFCCHWRPSGSLRSWTMLLFKDYNTTGAVPIWVAYTATWSYGDIQTWQMPRTI